MQLSDNSYKNCLHSSGWGIGEVICWGQSPWETPFIHPRLPSRQWYFFCHCLSLFQLPKDVGMSLKSSCTKNGRVTGFPRWWESLMSTPVHRFILEDDVSAKEHSFLMLPMSRASLPFSVWEMSWNSSQIDSKRYCKVVVDSLANMKCVLKGEILNCLSHTVSLMFFPLLHYFSTEAEQKGYQKIQTVPLNYFKMKLKPLSLSMFQKRTKPRGKKCLTDNVALNL